LTLIGRHKGAFPFALSHRPADVFQMRDRMAL
jgi:hypothetical protein